MGLCPKAFKTINEVDNSSVPQLQRKLLDKTTRHSNLYEPGVFSAVQNKTKQYLLRKIWIQAYIWQIEGFTITQIFESKTP